MQQETDRGLPELRKAALNSMNPKERQLVDNDWVNNIQWLKYKSIIDAQKSLDKAEATLKTAHHEIDLRVLLKADIIGITTSGIAKYRELLCRVAPRVLVCEEAGEVLEARMLPSFLPSIEHAILIGDYHQFRASVSNINLSSAKEGGSYSLDVSLFERLVSPFMAGVGQTPSTMLRIKRRKHPLISRLVRETVSPKLEDGSDVSQHPEVPGMKSRLFWMDHSHAQDERKETQSVETSYTNSFEVDFVAALAAHLWRQGCYAKGDIAVITAYRAQALLIENRLHSTEEVIVLEQGEQDRDGNTVRSRRIEKGPLLGQIRVATVDTFQGEEAKVVIISLVRSNKDRRTGFLKVPNRINVLLSRAKHGMYIIGDTGTASKVPTWQSVIEMLKDSDSLGSKLQLSCSHHPEAVISVSSAKDFQSESSDGGCRRLCGRPLSCGHICVSPCHTDARHASMGAFCRTMVDKTIKECGHVVREKCRRGVDSDFYYHVCRL